VLLEPEVDDGLRRFHLVLAFTSRIGGSLFRAAEASD
jgi:hypothetical protein